jgi:hypothetical protein
MFQTKGLVITGIESFVRDTFGDDGHQRWLAALSAETREVFARPVMASSWYPGERAAEMRQAICQLFFGGDAERMRELGRYQAERILRGVYKIFIKIGSPEWVAARCSKIFALHFKPGRLEIVDLVKGRLHLRLHDFPDRSGIMENIFFGFFEHAVKVSGAKEVKVTTGASMAKGDAHSEFEIRWGEHLALLD